MRRWSSIEIIAFRRLCNLRLDELKTFNLIVGPNNSGKTTVLEAIRLLGNPLDPWEWVKTSRGREIQAKLPGRLESIRSLFPQTRLQGYSQLFEGTVELKGDSEQLPVKVNAQLNELRYEPPEDDSNSLFEAGGDFRRGIVKVVTLEKEATNQCEFELDRRARFQPPSPPKSVAKTQTRYLSPFHHRVEGESLSTISNLLEGKSKTNLVQLLQNVDQTIQDVIVAVPDGHSPEIRVLRHGIGGIPLSAEGDGIRRSLAIAAEAVALTLEANELSGVLLIDEIETALHPTAMESALQLLKAACFASKTLGREVQIFATTHSLEVMDAISRVWSPLPAPLNVIGRPEDVAYYRLPRAGSKGPVVRYSLEEFRERREEAGVDIR